YAPLLSAQIITTIAGTPGVGGNSGDNGPATAATMGLVTGVMTDDNGNLYISDAGNNRVRKVNAAGIITTIAGSGPAGVSSYSGDNGPATAAILYGPYGLAMDKKGIYIWRMG